MPVSPSPSVSDEGTGGPKFFLTTSWGQLTGEWSISFSDRPNSHLIMLAPLSPLSDPPQRRPQAPPPPKKILGSPPDFMILFAHFPRID